MFFLFFQAEDGIRDYKVTGVQRVLFRSPLVAPRPRGARLTPRAGVGRAPLRGTLRHAAPPAPIRSALCDAPGGLTVEIGRASCREKSVDLGGRRIIKKKKERKGWGRRW